MVLNSTGFTFGNDGKNGDLKDGFIANNAGEISFITNLTNVEHNIITIHALKGYDGIANIEASCNLGCKCFNKTFNGLHKSETTEIVPYRLAFNQSDLMCILTIKLVSEGKQRITAISFE